jgi:hypothetical protein
VRHARAWAAALAVVACATGLAVDAQPASSFGARVAALSEPGGYFDTDNLISNERSYLQVIPGLQDAGVRGGAYIGVGPDTNFSYIAHIRPNIAFIVDIRRDNMLLHLLFKALFELSATRAQYLALLLGRAPPSPADDPRAASIERLVAHFDRTAASPDGPAAERIRAALRRTRVPLSAADMETIARFQRRFVEDGLGLRFNTLGRPPQANYPSYRDLLLETDAGGRRSNYLASEESFRYVKSLQDRDLIIPVVGDLGGPSALSAIGKLLTARRERLTAFYTSNVEYYLFGQGSYPKFIANLRRIPRARHGTIIRSLFARPWTGRPGDNSTSQLHRIDDVLGGYAEGRFRSYGQLVAERPDTMAPLR